jgi:hypothetical protein
MVHVGGLTLTSAIANGFSYANSHAWSNLGQGAPEVGPIPDAPDRPTTINMQVDELEYAPTTGVKGTVSRPLRVSTFSCCTQLFGRLSPRCTTTPTAKGWNLNIRLKTCALSLVVALDCLALRPLSVMCGCTPRDISFVITHGHLVTWDSKFQTILPMHSHWRYSAVSFPSLPREFPWQLLSYLLNRIVWRQKMVTSLT